MILLFLVACLPTHLPVDAADGALPCAALAAPPGPGAPRVQIHAWSQAEAMDRLHLETFDSELILESFVSVDDAFTGQVYSTLALDAGGRGWGSCSRCDKDWVAARVDEVERRPYPPDRRPPRPSHSLPRLGQSRRGGVIGGILGLALLPLFIVGAGVMTLESLDDHEPLETVYGGPLTDRAMAALHPSPCAATAGHPCRTGGLLVSEGEPDPLRHGRDVMTLSLTFSGGESPAMTEVIRCPIPPGASLAERIEGLVGR